MNAERRHLSPSSSSSPFPSGRPQRTAAKLAAFRIGEEPTHSDPDSSEQDDTSDDEHHEDGDESKGDGGGSDEEDHGWDIAEILEERILYDGRSYQRQYWVQRVDQERTVSGQSRFTEADAHDAKDMTPAVLNAWRMENPLVDVPWVYGGKARAKKQKEKSLSVYKAQWVKHCQSSDPKSDEL